MNTDTSALSPRCAHPSVMIVDDNVDLAENLKEVLEEEGVEVHLAPNGYEALRLLETVSPQLVVTDMRMPGMSGVGLIKEIRKSRPGLPVVLITAYSQDQQLAEARAQGVLAVLPKPLDLGYLCTLVERLTEAGEQVLVVDGEADERNDVIDALQEIEGVKPLVASNAAEARRIAAQCDFVAAIISVHLSDEDGLSLGIDLQRQAQAESRRLPVVYLSHGGEITRLEPLLGQPSPQSVHLIRKPVARDTLLSTIKKLL